jgi:hypothetical protein
MGFALALLLGATIYLFDAYLVLNIGLIPFSPAAVYTAQLLIIPGIIAFTRKTAAENREKMKPQAVVRIDGGWNHRRNGSAHLLDMIDVGSGRIVDFEMVQKTTASGRGNYEGSSNGMEVEALRRMVKRWEDDQNVAVVVTDQDSKMAKVIRKSRNVRYEYNANHAKKALDRYCQGLPKEER